MLTAAACGSRSKAMSIAVSMMPACHAAQVVQSPELQRQSGCQQELKHDICAAGSKAPGCTYMRSHTMRTSH